MLARKPVKPAKVIILSLLLLLAIGGIGYVVVQNFMLAGGSVVPPEVQQNIVKIPAQLHPPVPRLNPNPSLFLSPQFTNLRQFTELPVRAGVTGRPNPFLPIEYYAPPLTSDAVSQPPLPPELEPRDGASPGTAVWP